MAGRPRAAGGKDAGGSAHRRGATEPHRWHTRNATYRVQNVIGGRPRRGSSIGRLPEGGRMHRLDSAAGPLAIDFHNGGNTTFVGSHSSVISGRNRGGKRESDHEELGYLLAFCAGWRNKRRRMAPDRRRAVVTSFFPTVYRVQRQDLPSGEGRSYSQRYVQLNVRHVCNFNTPRGPVDRDTVRLVTPA
jgi:hypothetical protein